MKYKNYFIKTRKEKPTQIALELSNRCNAKCAICPLFQSNDKVDKKKRKPMDMSYALFEKAVTEVKEWCPEASIFLNMFGEALLDSNICKKLELLNKLGLSRNVYLQTNGTCLNKEIAHSILTNNIGTLVPCFDSADKEIFEAVRCGVTFENILHNLKEFIQLRKYLNANTKIALQHVVSKLNQNQHKEVYDLFNPILSENDCLNITTATAWASPELRHLTFLDFKEEQLFHTCDIVENSLIILADGAVCACCHDYNLKHGSMGDINSESMQSMWHNEKYLKLRQSIASGKENLKSPCTECTVLFADFTKKDNYTYGFNESLITDGHHGIIVKFTDEMDSKENIRPLSFKQKLVNTLLPPSSLQRILVKKIKSALFLPQPEPPRAPLEAPQPTQDELYADFIKSLRNATNAYLPEAEQGKSALPYNRWYWLTEAGRLLCPEYRFHWLEIDWIKNSNFTTYLQEIGEESGFNADRRWFIGQMLRLVSHIPGDMAECGTYTGATARLLIQACKPYGKKLHLFDSFEGVFEPKEIDGIHWSKGALSADETLVHEQLATFATRADYTCYKGWIPERFNEVKNYKFSFVHIDVDLYEPTLDSVAFFYSRMSDGAICVCDDYGHWTCPGATQAIDEFLADKPEKMLAMPSGGGFFIKGTQTGLQPISF